MSFRRHHYHQHPVELGETHYAPLLQELVQAPPSPDTATRGGARAGWAKRYWEIHRPEDSGWKTEAQSRTVFCKKVFIQTIQII